MKFARDLIPRIDAVRTRRRRSFPDITEEIFWSYYETCKHTSLLHVTGFYNLFQSMIYIRDNAISGCAVECGCFLGGAAAFLGLMRNHLHMSEMEIVLFDTFEGPPAGSTDKFYGRKIETPRKLRNYEQQIKTNITQVLGSTEGFQFIAGLVEDTLPEFEPRKIALLRLDTDFYSSTKVELERLYPQLCEGGVLIVDDYGSFEGSRTATDEYFANHPNPPLLSRIDAGIRAG